MGIARQGVAAPCLPADKGWPVVAVDEGRGKEDLRSAAGQGGLDDGPPQGQRRRRRRRASVQRASHRRRSRLCGHARQTLVVNRTLPSHIRTQGTRAQVQSPLFSVWPISADFAKPIFGGFSSWCRHVFACACVHSVLGPTRGRCWSADTCRNLTGRVRRQPRAVRTQPAAFAGAFVRALRPALAAAAGIEAAVFEPRMLNTGGP